MMTPRSRARNGSNQRNYGNVNSSIHPRGGGNAMLGGPMRSHPPTINIVDSSGYPQQISHNQYNENANDYYDSPGRSYGSSNPAHYGMYPNEGRIANASLPNSPGNTRNSKSLGAARLDGISTSTSNLPGGGGAGSFYWAAKVITLVICFTDGSA